MQSSTRTPVAFTSKQFQGSRVDRAPIGQGSYATPVARGKRVQGFHAAGFRGKMQGHKHNNSVPGTNLHVLFPSQPTTAARFSRDRVLALSYHCFLAFSIPISSTSIFLFTGLKLVDKWNSNIPTSSSPDDHEYNTMALSSNGRANGGNATVAQR